MQAQQRRDEKTITIFIGLLLTAVGPFLLSVLGSVVDLRGDLWGFIVGAALLVAFVYILRRRRP